MQRMLVWIEGRLKYSAYIILSEIVTGLSITSINIHPRDVRGANYLFDPKEFVRIFIVQVCLKSL